MLVTKTSQSTVAGRTRSRRRSGLWIGAIAAGAATLATAVAVASMTSSPAYAVDQRGDGTVEVTIKEFVDAKGLQRRLIDAGIPAVIDYIPDGKGTCTQPRGDELPPNQTPMLTSPQGDSPASFSLSPAMIRADQTLVLEAIFDARNPENASAVRVSIVRGPVSACNPTAGPTDGPTTGPIIEHTDDPASGSTQETYSSSGS